MGSVPGVMNQDGAEETKRYYIVITKGRAKKTSNEERRREREREREREKVREVASLKRERSPELVGLLCSERRR
jgi:hypothetical protein